MCYNKTKTECDDYENQIIEQKSHLCTVSGICDH